MFGPYGDAQTYRNCFDFAHCNGAGSLALDPATRRGLAGTGKDCFDDFFKRCLRREQGVGLAPRDRPGAETVKAASFAGGQAVAGVTRSVVVRGVEFPGQIKGMRGLRLESHRTYSSAAADYSHLCFAYHLMH